MFPQHCWGTKHRLWKPWRAQLTDFWQIREPFDRRHSQMGWALGERRRRIGHQHQSPAAQHGIDRIALEIDVLGIKNAVLDIRQAEQRCLAACRFHHVFREIRGYQFPCRSNYFCHGQSSVAGAGSKLQNGLLRINDRAIGTLCRQIGGPGHVRCPALSGSPTARRVLRPGGRIVHDLARTAAIGAIML